MLGDVLGFCAAAHLYSEKIGQTVEVWFDPTRKDACNWFAGVKWVEKTAGMIDCGGDPSLAEWPQMNGVKRFYRFMDPTMKPTKSFDIHFMGQKPETENIIGLITHSNTQGDIDPVTLKEMITEAKRLYPGTPIALIGNLDNTLVPEGVEDRRQAGGDINWIIHKVGTLKLLITPQSGPCFPAAGWGVPMWIYRSKESFWDFTLNYDTYKVERWFDRKNPQGPKDLYINWKSGLGDAILHVSLYYHYAKHSGKKLYFYGNSSLIDRKMRDFVDLAREIHPDIDQWIEQVPVRKIRPVDGGPENFAGWKPIPSDNCIPEHWKDFECFNFISCMIKVMNFEGKNRKADDLDFYHGYLHYSPKANVYVDPAIWESGHIKNKVVVHLIGTSSGTYATNYEIDKEKIKSLIDQLHQGGTEIVFLQPHDEWMKKTFPWATFKDLGQDMKALFDEVASSQAVIAVDSGIAHVALCCGKLLYTFKMKRSGGLGFQKNDMVLCSEIDNVVLCGSPCLMKPGKVPVKSLVRVTNIADELVYRENTTDRSVINSVIVENEYELNPTDVVGKVIMDIGGNIGAFSAMCASWGARKVICCEPMIDNLIVLSKNVQKYPNISVITAAIGRSDDQRQPIARLSVSGNNFGGAHVIYSKGDMIVPVIGLDDILEEVDLLKIDCEGSEFPILYTTSKLSKIKKIVGEFHNFREGDDRYSESMLSGHSISDYTIEGLSDYLRRQGMEVTFRYFADGIGFFKAWWK